MSAAWRWAFGVLVAAELLLVACLVAGIRVPAPVVAVAELFTAVVVVVGSVELGRAYRSFRADGLPRREAVAAAVRARVPVVVRRLVWHEFLLWACLFRWVARRPHGVREGDTAAAYTGAQGALVYGMLFVSVVETVALAYLIPWPLVDAVVLVIDLWGVFFVVGLQASCVVRPHVVGADGSLRVRYGALVDIRVPADRIESARVDRRYPSGSLLKFGGAGRAGDGKDEAGTVDVIVGSMTTVTVRLSEPVAFRRPLGKPAQVRTLRFHADDPRPLVAALSRRQPDPQPDPQP